MYGGQFEPPVQYLAFARAQEARQTGAVPAAQVLGDDQFVQGPPEGFLEAPSEHVFGALTPVDGDAAGVHADDGVQGVVQDGADPLLAGAYRLRHLRHRRRKHLDFLWTAIGERAVEIARLQCLRACRERPQRQRGSLRQQQRPQDAGDSEQGSEQDDPRRQIRRHIATECVYEGNPGDAGDDHRQQQESEHGPACGDGSHRSA